MQGSTGLFLGLAVLAAFALTAGGVRLLRRSSADRLRGGLMIVAAVVLLANVLILTWPLPSQS